MSLLLLKSMIVGVACVLVGLILLRVIFEGLIIRHQIFAFRSKPNALILVLLYVLLLFLVGFFWRLKR